MVIQACLPQFTKEANQITQIHTAKIFSERSFTNALKNSTFCKVHQNACCNLKNQAIGTSRGRKSRTPIAITILVNVAHEGSAKIFYRDIGDYLSREEKLTKIKRIGMVLNDFEEIFPNERGD